MSMRAEIREITPELASHWIENNTRNRVINNSRVKDYVNLMLQDRWPEHHQGVAFYTDGALADGQHRLLAIQKTGIAKKMVVVWGVPEEASLVIDSHQRRQPHQAIKISGAADWIGKDHLAIARTMQGIEGIPTNMDIYERIAYCEKHKSAIIFSTEAVKVQKRYITPAAMRASIACAFYHEDSGRLIDFSNVITTGMVESSDDKPAIMLREYLLESRSLSKGDTAKLETVKRIMRAIKAFCNREKISKLRQPPDFIYLPQ